MSETPSPRKQPYSAEYRLYIRDLFFFIVTCVVSIIIAEVFVFGTEGEIAITSRIFTYAILIIPLTLVVMVLSYNYRTRRIEKTGVIRSSIRYKLIVAFIFVSILPSIPIVLLSGDLIEKTIEAIFSVDIRQGLDAGLRIAEDHLNDEREQFVDRLDNLPQFAATYKPINAYLKNKKYIQPGEYFGLVKGKKVIKENLPMLSQVYNALEFQKVGDGKIKEAEFGTEDYNYLLYRLPLGGENAMVVGKLFGTKFSENVSLLRRTSKEFNEAAYFKGNLSEYSFIALFVVSVLLVLAAVIVSFNLARQISEPLMSLAVATRRITQGKHEHQIELEAKGEMGVLIESFNQMVVSISNYKQQIKQSQRLSVWKEVAQRVAHEIKNPLTPIQLNAERLKRKFSKAEENELTEFVDKTVKIILQEVDIIKRLVNEFSQFARMPNPKKESCSLDNIMREVISGYDGRPGLDIKVQYDGSMPPLMLDYGLIRQVFSNLIKNSVEAMSDDNGDPQKDAIIDIRFYTETVVGEPVYCIDLEDNGPGVAAEIREKLFEPYFSTKKEGTGIGLAISEKILIDHGARITASDSEKYSGLKFQIRFEGTRI